MKTAHNTEGYQSLKGRDLDIPSWPMPEGRRIDASFTFGASDDARRERNLVIVHTPGAQEYSDFAAVKELIAARAPDIEVFIVDNGSPQSATRKKAAGRPTLVFSPVDLRAFRPQRGKIYAGGAIRKIAQVAMLKAAGIPVPHAVLLDESTTFDGPEWGDFIVLKPNAGSLGKGVRLTNRERALETARDLGWPKRNYVAQVFIDTGIFPAEYRCLTVFGEPVYCNKVESLEQRPDLGPDLPQRGRIASNSGPRRSTPCNDADVLDLARRTFAVFPHVPVQGMDIIRDAKTGALYVLEVNAGGATWHLSSVTGKRLQERNGYSYYQQFDALSVVADRLIDVTRREAE